MIVAGFGFRSRATDASFRSALERTGMAPDSLAAPEGKAGSDALKRLVSGLGLELFTVSNDDLAQIDTPTRSKMSQHRFGTGSVCEAAALWAAGRGARIMVTRVISEDGCATCALAEGPGR